MSRIYLIRHGRTPANDRHLYCGSTDISLSESGVEALKQLHYDVPQARFLTSGMARTEETLKLLFGDVPHEINREFREINFGAFEMHSYDELKDDPAYQAWITGDNQRNVPPGGESGEAMTQRVLSAFRALAAAGEDTVLITHGGVIAAIMENLFPEAGKNRYQWQPKPGYGYLLENGGYTPIP